MAAMMPVKEVIEGLRRHEFELRFALERDVRLNMEAAAKVSRGFLGEYQPGWAELAQATIDEKQRLGFATPSPLKRTGALEESIAGEAEEAGLGVRGIVGSSSDLAEIHEHGTSRIPARPFLGPALMLVETKISEDLGHLAVRALTPGSRL